MHWHDANEFFSMGGRGGFVWGAYGVMALLLVVESTLARRRHRAARRAIAERMADESAAARAPDRDAPHAVATPADADAPHPGARP